MVSRQRLGPPRRPHYGWRRRHRSPLNPRSRRGAARNYLATLLAAISTLAGAAPALAEITGPDVASWQHPGGASIDWTQVKADGRGFAFVKATEDTTYSNPYFAADWKAIPAAGMYRGAYHFARPASSPTQQGTYFAAVVGDLQQPGTLPPVLDLEDSGGLAPSALVAWTHSFLTQVQNLTGRTPMIYASPNFWINSMGNSTEFTGYPLWIARWTSASTPNPLPGGWSTWTFWQYTDAGSIPGITGNVDVSRFNGDGPGLTALATTFTDLRCPSSTDPVVAATGPDGSLYDKPAAAWCALGGRLIDAPAVTTVPQGSGSGTPLYIGVGTDHDLWVRSQAQGWQRLSTATLYCIGNPAATVSGGPGSAVLHVACQGADRALWYGRTAIGASGLPTTSGGDWQSLAGRLSAGPAVAVIVGDSSPTFFVTGTDGSIWWRGVISQYLPFGASCLGHPAASTGGSTSYFACDGQDHGLWFASNSGGGWGALQSAGGNLIDGPGVAVRTGAATIFAEGADGAVWDRAVNGNTPVSGWAPDHGYASHGVAAVNPS